MAIGRGLCRLPLALQPSQFLSLFEPLQHVQVGRHDLDVDHGVLQAEFALLDSQFTLVPQAVHSPGIVEHVVCRMQSLLGERQVLLKLQFPGPEPSFEVLRNGEPLDGGLGPEADGCILRQVGVLGAFVEVLFDGLVFECDQFVTRLDPCPVLDHPVDRAVAPDPALDLRAVETLQRSLLDHGDRQSSPLDRVDGLRTQHCLRFGD